MQIRTCNCEQCRYRKTRQNRHGTSILKINQRSVRRIIRQKLKYSVARKAYDVVFDPYRNIPALA